MSKIQELIAQKEALDRAIQQAHKSESKEALETIHRLIATFGFTAQQVFPFQAPAKKTVPAKYYNPENGQSWSGRGKPPKWIEGKDRSQFEVVRTPQPVAPESLDPSNPFPIQ
ncbi:MAG: H-NS family nucleoid-associated regulatory protein [Comamonas sp.]